MIAPRRAAPTAPAEPPCADRSTRAPSDRRTPLDGSTRRRLGLDGDRRRRSERSAVARPSARHASTRIAAAPRTLSIGMRPSAAARDVPGRRRSAGRSRSPERSRAHATRARTHRPCARRYRPTRVIDADASSPRAYLSRLTDASAPRSLAVAMKTQMSRFHIHDDLTAPEGSLPVLKGALVVRRAAPELPRRARRARRRRCAPTRASAPSCATARCRRRRSSGSRSRSPSTTARKPGPRDSTRARRAQAGARHRRGRAARASGTPRDAARGRAAALPQARSLEHRGDAPMHLHEEAREAGWSDEQLLEAIAVRRAGVLHGDGQRRRRGSGRRLRRGDARAARRVSLRWRAGRRTHGRRRHARAPTEAQLLPAPTTRRSSWSASAGPARSSSCCCEGGADALLGDRAARSRALRPAAVRAHEGARGARDRRAPRRATARRCASSTS